MTTRILSGNLTISMLQKRFKDTWSLKLKNNLTMDGVPFEISSVENFQLVNESNNNSVISKYTIDNDLFVEAELDLKLVDKYIQEESTKQIYAILTIGNHEEVVEVLAWNKTIISHVSYQDDYYRVGIGRNSNNLFMGWKQFSELQISNVNIDNDILLIDIESTEPKQYVLKDINNEEYPLLYKEDLNRYSLNLNTLNLSGGNEFFVKNIIDSNSLKISKSIQNNEFIWNDKGIQFDYDNLGNVRLTVLKQYVFISELDEKDSDIKLTLQVPNGLYDENVTAELCMKESNTPIYVQPINGILFRNDLIEMKVSIKYNELIPYGEHNVLLRILNSKKTVLKTFPILLGTNRINFFESEENFEYTMREVPTVKNSPLKICRNDNTSSQEQLEKYTDFLLNSRLKRQTAEYVTYRENLPIETDTIFYESFFGALSDSPLALFKTIYEEDVEKKYTHIWCVSDLNSRGPLSNYCDENIIFVKYNSSDYLRWLAIAEKFVFNTSTALPFSRRKGQEVLQTWHGVPLKTLGHDMEQTKGLNRNVIRSVAQATLYTNPNRYTEQKVLESLDLLEVQKSNRMLVSYPRQQRVLKANSEGFKEYLSNVMPINPNKKIALYAPTWRGENGNYKNVAAEYMKAIDLFNKYLPNDYQLIFKPHLNAAKFFKNNQSVVIVPNWIDVNEVLSVTDLLISDYSSIIFDFYFTGRPVINWMYDKDDYVKNNGFYPEIFTELIWPTNSEKKLSWMLSNLNKYPKPKNPFVTVSEQDVKNIIKVFLDNKLDNNLLTKSKGKKVNLYIVYANRVIANKEKAVTELNRIARQNSEEKLALLHIGNYTKNDDGFFENLSDDILHFYRTDQPGATVAEYVLIQKLKFGKNISHADKLSLKSFIQRELQRSLGNIEVSQVNMLGLVKSDDWATQALVKMKNDD